MSRAVKTLGTVALLLLLGTAGCKDPTARRMAEEVADVLVAYGHANGVYLNILHDAVCNLDRSIWDPTLNPNPANPTLTLIKPRDPVGTTALCPPGQPERADPPDDPIDPF